MHKDVVCQKLLKTSVLNKSSENWILIHCDRMPQSYFDNFSFKEIQKHIVLIEELSSTFFFKAFVQDAQKKNCFRITLVCNHVPWLMVALTGNLSLRHFDIRKGFVFNYGEFSSKEKFQKKTYEQQRKKIVNVLDLFYSRERAFFEEDYQEFLKDMQSFFKKIRAGQINELRFSIISRIGTRLSEIPLQKETVLLKMMIDIEVKGEMLIFSIVAKDTQFFLFSLALALRSLNIDISEIEINTKSGCVEDILVVRDCNHRLYKDPSAIKRLKIVLALIKYLTYLLPSAFDHNKVFRCFELFVDQILNSGTSSVEDMDWFDPENLSSFAAIFQSGTYLMEQFVKMQYKMFIPFFEDKSWTARQESFRKDFETVKKELKEIDSLENCVDCVNKFKDKQLFFLDMCHLIYPDYSFNSFGKDLSVLAQNVLQIIAKRLWKELCREKGVPMYKNNICGYALMRLGKWGGDELGYASDLEVVLVYEGYGKTDSCKEISNQEFFNLFMKKLKESVRTKSEQIFELDLRLRPDGSKGPLSASLKRWKDYYSKGFAKDIECQALIKMSAIFGEKTLIKEILGFRDELIYMQKTKNSSGILDLRDLQKKTRLKHGQINAKFSDGALVDLEYSVQFLQIKYGAKHKNLRVTNTLEAMRSLLENRLITPQDYEQLSNAYIFFRKLINALRMVRGHAGDLLVPPLKSNEFFFLTRRMKYQREDHLHKDLVKNMHNTKSFFDMAVCDIVFRAKNSLTVSDIVMFPYKDDSDAIQILKRYKFHKIKEVYKSLRSTYLHVQDKTYFLTLILTVIKKVHSSPDPDQVIFRFELLFKKASTDFLRQLFYDPKILDCIISVFGQSDFLSQIVLSDPKAMDEIFRLQLQSTVQNPQEWIEGFQCFQNSDQSLEEYFDALRQFRNRLILRIALRDFLEYSSFSLVIQELSHLADIIVDNAFQRILAEYGALDLYEKQVIIALGKMGGQELNYSSDIDLLFVVEQNISEEQMCILCDVQKKLILHLTQSSGYFSLYRVDMRLRPYGSSGSLVLREDGYRKYYKRQAHGWELQAWLKARVVCGSPELGKALIRDVRVILFDTRKRSSVFKSVAKMRKQKCKWLKKRNLLFRDVKSGYGGIRDIEFYVQRLQMNWGSLYPDLISGHTLYVLDRLRYHKILSKTLADKIRKHYIFLRKAEHCLQILGMRQDHLIPNKKKDRFKLAKQMGYRDLLKHSAEEIFMKEYQSIQKSVAQLLQSLALEKKSL